MDEFETQEVKLKTRIKQANTQEEKCNIAWKRTLVQCLTLGDIKPLMKVCYAG